MDPACERFVESGDLRLHVREEGEPDAPTVLLVHGYPDNSSLWDGVAAKLKERFHVVRYDVRGHGRSGTPRDGYRLDSLVDDMAAVVRATSPNAPVHLVGHDWGAAQGWHAVVERPELFASFTSISGPSLAHVSHWMRRHPLKALWPLAHSWYIAGFLLPWLPELVLWPLRRRLHADYRDLRHGLGLYRANIPTREEPRHVTLRVQQIVLTRDPYVTGRHLEATEPWVGDLTRRQLVADHWAPRTHPGHVARMVTEFIDHTPRRQLVLITGAGSGIGKATAEAFARQGADVIAVDLDLEAAKETSPLAYQLDVADSAATQVLAQEISTAHGVPDVVMANAGIAVIGPFLATSEQDWREVVDVNLWGVVHTLRTFVPHMVERAEGGHVVIIASMAGYFPTTALPAYSATKSAVLMLAQCLGEELAPHGIGVSAICPGLVRTNITRNARFAGADAERRQRQRAAVARIYRWRDYGPEKVANAVLAAVRSGKRVVPVTPEARLVRLLARVSPGLVRVAGKFAGPTWRQ